MTRLFAAAAALLVAAPAPAADRPPLRTEPAYRSKAPQYLLLAFGPKAETRAWAVLDLCQEWITQKPTADDALYVHLNGNGDLTDPGERVPAATVTRKETGPGGRTATCSSASAP